MESTILKCNTKTSAEVSCAQLQKLADEIRKNPKLGNVRLLHDNVSPHITKIPQKIMDRKKLYCDHRATQTLSDQKRYDDHDHIKNDLRAFSASDRSSMPKELVGNW